jgi:hypothetical protein
MSKKGKSSSSLRRPSAEKQEDALEKIRILEERMEEALAQLSSSRNIASQQQEPTTPLEEYSSFKKEFLGSQEFRETFLSNHLNNKQMELINDLNTVLKNGDNPNDQETSFILTLKEALSAKKPVSKKGDTVTLDPDLKADLKLKALVMSIFLVYNISSMFFSNRSPPTLLF